MFPSIGSVMWNMNQLNPWLNAGGILDLVIMKCCHTLATSTHRSPSHQLHSCHTTQRQPAQILEKRWKKFICLPERIEKRNMFEDFASNFELTKVFCFMSLGKQIFLNLWNDQLCTTRKRSFLDKNVYRCVALRMDVMKIY